MIHSARAMAGTSGLTTVSGSEGDGQTAPPRSSAHEGEVTTVAGEITYWFPGRAAGLRIVRNGASGEWFVPPTERDWYFVSELPDDGDGPIWYGFELSRLLAEMKSLGVAALRDEDPVELASQLEARLLESSLEAQLG